MRRTPLSIARLEEARQAEMTVEAALLSEPIAGGWMSYGGKGSWMNQAVGLGLKGPVDPSDVDRLIDFYASRGIQPKVELCPFADPTLVTALSDRGFRIREFENVMARSLTKGEDLKALHPHGWPENLEIVIADTSDATQLDTFIDVSTSGFRPAGSPVSEPLRQVTQVYVTRPRCLSFLAMVDGKAVGGSGLDIGGKIACLMGTSVLPEWRRKGVQAALMIRRLEVTREHGVPLACIHSLPGIPTERNATRLGFSMAYTKAVMVKPGKGLIPSP
ncbi:MAG TPA: GNAT family N-acetyltransferase [Rhodothermia bacterium]|nr:GNAT family N-acetyltransferase [Rhodothermia bacterium]